MDIPLEATSLLYKDTERDQHSVEEKCRALFKQDSGKQWKYSIISAVIFLIVSSPFMYFVVQKLLGSIVTISVKGCPTLIGLLLHTVVFALVSYGVMQLNL